MLTLKKDDDRISKCVNFTYYKYVMGDVETMLEDLSKASNRTVGMKQTLKAIRSGKACKVYLARDVDDYTAKKIQEECQAQNVDIVMVDSMELLGKACKIDVGAATAAILK